MKKCQLCNCLVKDLTNHLQHYHSKEPTDIKKPKKRDTDILNDKLNDENMKEIGIDENKKKILRRTVNPISHKVGEINENLNEINLNSASIVEKKPFNKSGKNKKSNIIKLYDTSAKAKQKKKGNKKFNNNIRLNNANYINSDKKSPKNRKKLNLQNSADKKGVTGAITDIGVVMNNEIADFLAFGFRPVVYIHKNVEISSGKGTKEEPYRIAK